MNQQEQNAACADMLREAAAEMPRTLGWAVYAAADHVGKHGLNDRSRALVRFASLQFETAEPRAWLGSKLARAVALISHIPGGQS